MKDETPLIGDAGLLGVLSDTQKRFDAAIQREEFNDGIYELQDPPPKGSGRKIVLPAGWKEGDKVWVRVQVFQNLGVKQTWGDEIPQEILECKKQGHEPKDTRRSNSFEREIRCSLCGYFYTIGD